MESHKGSGECNSPSILKGANMNLEQQELNTLLPSFLLDDTLTVSEVSDLITKMKRLNDIENKFKNKIKQRKDGKQFYIYINRKQYTSTSYNGLLNVLYDYYYGRQNYGFADLFPEWLIWKRDHSSITGKTLREYKILWENMLANEPIIHIPLKDLKPKDFVQLFRKWTKNREMTRKYFNNVKSILNGIYAYAIEDELVLHNPIKEIDMRQFSYKPVNNDYDVFSLDERKNILNSLEYVENVYSLAIQLDFHVVCRIGELLALRWSDINGNFIRIQGQYLTDESMNDDLTFNSRTHKNFSHVKGNTAQGFRYMPLMPDALLILNKIKQLNPDGEYILMQDGKQLNANTFNRHLKKQCLLLNITPRSSHKIRFTVASMLFDKGVPLTTLQQLLGHTTTAMTLHYLRPITPLDETYNAMQCALSS